MEPQEPEYVLDANFWLPHLQAAVSLQPDTTDFQDLDEPSEFDRVMSGATFLHTTKVHVWTPRFSFNSIGYASCRRLSTGTHSASTVRAIADEQDREAAYKALLTSACVAFNDNARSKGEEWVNSQSCVPACLTNCP